MLCVPVVVSQPPWARDQWGGSVATMAEAKAGSTPRAASSSSSVLTMRRGGGGSSRVVVAMLRVASARDEAFTMADEAARDLGRNS